MIGQTIGDYKIVGSLGKGAMAEVYDGRHPQTGQRVAIKVIKSHLSADDEFLRRFAREAKLIAAIDHPHIVKVLGYQVPRSAAETGYIIMEYIAGSTLQNYLRYTLQRGQYFSLMEAAQMMQQVGAALDYAHKRGIVHRDVKPSNVMRTADGRYILTDFGLARSSADTKLTATGITLGTPAYMCPEHALGQPGDHRADIYSLGIMLFELMVGRLPFESTSLIGLAMQQISMTPPVPSQLRPTLPTWIDNVVLKALAKKPADRYATIAELLAEFDHMPAAQETVLMPAEATETAVTIIEPVWPEVTPVVSAPDQTRPHLFAKPFQVPPRAAHYVERPEVTEIEKQLLAVHDEMIIIGLYGLPAVGKSTVALELGHALADYFDDGVLWASFEEQTAEQALSRIASAYGQGEALNALPTVQAKGQYVRQLLQNKQLLLILDHIENSEQLSHFLPLGPDAAVLLTSRNRSLLQSQTASLYPLGPFDLPLTIAYLNTAVGRARVQAEEAEIAVLQVLSGGIPLALSVVAGFMRDREALTFAAYNEILRDEQTRLEHLVDWEEGARNVGVSFELSYQQLPPPLQKLLQAGAIFEGRDFDSRALAAVAETPAARVKIGLGRLQTFSLLDGNPKKEQGSSVRYKLNPLLKLFVRQKIGKPQQDGLQARAAAYFEELVQNHHDLADYDLLDEEWTNIVGSLRWLAAHAQWATFRQTLLRLSQPHLGTLGFLEVRGHWHGARDFLKTAAEGSAALDADTEINLLTRRGGFAIKQGDIERGRPLLEDALAKLDQRPLDGHSRQQIAVLCDLMADSYAAQDPSEALEWVWRGWRVVKATAASEPADDHLLGHLYTRIGRLQAQMGQFAEATNALNLGLQLLPDAPNSSRATGLMTLGMIQLVQGRFEQSAAYLEKAVQIATALGDVNRLAMLEQNLGVTAVSRGQWAQAQTYYETAIDLHRHLGNAYLECGTRLNLVEILVMRGDYETAAQQVAQVQTLATPQPFPDIEAMALSWLAQLAKLTGAYKQALHYAQQAAGLAEQLDLGYLRPTLLRQQAQALAGQEKYADALPLLEEALALAKETEEQEELGIGWRVKGEILAQQGDAPAAVAALQRSQALLTEHNPYQLAITLLTYLAQGGPVSLWDEAQAIAAALESPRLVEWVAQLKP